MSARFPAGSYDTPIQDDFALPAQIYHLWHGTRAVTPERRLALAVLAQAVLDLERFRYAKRRRPQRFYWEAYEWIACDDRSWPYAFASLCDMLGLQTEAVRAALLDPSRPTGDPGHIVAIDDAA